MKKLRLISEPIAASTSVQRELLLSLAACLRDRYELSLFAPCVGENQAKELARAGFEVITPGSSPWWAPTWFDWTDRRNESMLWAGSWLREVLHAQNEADARKALCGLDNDYTINLTMTVAFPSDLWWIQGMPLDLTLKGMSQTNFLAWVAHKIGAPFTARVDDRLLRRIARLSHRIVTNSPYLRQVYESRGFHVDGAIPTVKDFSSFYPASNSPRRDYVLLYIGKETGPLNLEALKRAGVRIVAFGSKIPPSTRIRFLASATDFRGQVSHQELVELYSNALFTLFPFSYEPLGYVPIESMACGTPVLTYGQQGPGSTVLDGQTGWFVHSPAERGEMAALIWRNGRTGIDQVRCVERARDFSPQQSVTRIIEYIEDHENPEPDSPGATGQGLIPRSYP